MNIGINIGIQNITNTVIKKILSLFEWGTATVNSWGTATSQTWG
jgi:hypothetical protein